jgi:maltose-binding protein MalE
MTMKTKVFLCAAFLVCALSAGCRSSNHEESAGKESGTSLETAIVIHSKGEKDGYKDQLDWLVKHYPDYQVKKQSLVKSKNKKVYNCIEITVGSGQEFAFYFDITKCYGKNEHGEDVHFY